MNRTDSVQGAGGWLLVYLIGSIPPMMVYAVGLSGAFFEYPPILMTAIFLLFTVPLWLILLKSSSAPRWNIAMLWIMACLITLRSVAVLASPSGGGEPLGAAAPPEVMAALSGIVAFSLGWAILWTKYFKESVRVRNTFC